MRDIKDLEKDACLNFVTKYFDNLQKTTQVSIL